MSSKCTVPDCENMPGKGGKSFHRFPSDPLRKEKWISAIQSHYDSFNSNSLASYSSVCCDHFLPANFMDSDLFLRKTLKNTAVPSLFTGMRRQNRCQQRQIIACPKMVNSGASSTVGASWTTLTLNWIAIIFLIYRVVQICLNKRNALILPKKSLFCLRCLANVRKM